MSAPAIFRELRRIEQSRQDDAAVEIETDRHIFVGELIGLGTGHDGQTAVALLRIDRSRDAIQAARVVQRHRIRAIALGDIVAIREV